MRALCVLLVLGAACHHGGDSAGAPPPTVDQDALWKLAPDGTKLGIVISSRGIAMIEHAAADVHAFMAKAPELAPVVAKLDALLQGHSLDLASYGLAPGKGAAAFFIDDNTGVVIVPIADRDKFLTAFHGTKGDQQDTLGKDTVCATTHGVYACAPNAAIFDRLGKGAHPPDAGARGDIEVFSDHFANSPVTVAVTAQLHRGGVTVHGSIAGIPGDKLALLGGADKPRLAGDRTTGFAIAHVKPLFDFVARNEPRQQALAASLGDPLTVTMEANSYDAQLPLTDPSIVKAFLDHCADGPLAMLGAKVVDGKCHVVVPNAPGMELDGWLDGNTLHVAQKGAAGPSVPLTHLGKELADQSWQLAFYGHGSLFAAGQLYGQMAQQIPPDAADFMKMGIRAITAFEELGAAARVENGTLKLVVGVRTIWDNPDDVIAKIAAIDPSSVLAGTSVPAVKAIADAAPDSPFANEVHAGYGGLMVETAGVGMAAAAVAIPAFLDYTRRARDVQHAVDADDPKPIDDAPDVKQGTGGGGDAVAKLEAIKVKACACSDMACATDATKQLQQWSQEQFAGGGHGLDADQTKISQVTSDIAQCLGRAMSAPH